MTDMAARETLFANAPAAPKPRRWWRDRLTLSLGGLLLLISAGLAAPLIAPHDPNTTNMLARMEPPVWLGGTWTHVLGTDQIGRDLLSRTLHGIRTSFGIAAFGLIFSAVFGIGLGLVAGFFGSWVDRAIMMFTDIFISLPNLLLILCGIAILGTQTWVLVLMIGLVRWEAYARLVRGQVLSMRDVGYVESARVLGAGALWIGRKHLLPNLASPLIVALTLSFPGVLLMEAGLSFLGVGVQPPTSSLGRMIGDGRNYLVNAWWIAGIPSIAVVTIVLMFQIAGDAIRDRLDQVTDD